MADYDAQPGRETDESALSAGQIGADEVDLYAGLRGVAGLVAGAKGVVDLLGDVAEFAAQAIPGVDGAGVALVDGGRLKPSVQTWAATAVLVQDIDNIQYGELNEGPWHHMHETAADVVSGSLGSDHRWPSFGGRVARMRVHSALSLPLIVGEQLIGAINAYAWPRDAFGEHAVQLGTLFAATAAVSIYNAQLLAGAHEQTQRLQRALESRAVIDQAVGIIRSRSGVGPEVAFDRLVRMSQSENVKLRAVAERLVDEAVRRAVRRQP